MPIPENFVIDGRLFARHTLVETGTFKGATVRAAILAGFKRVASVDRVVHSTELSGSELDPRIELYLGSSPDRLSAMCRPDEETLIYLDAHYMGDGAEVDPVYGECPLLAELEEITAVSWKTPPAIVIDDAPLFLRPWDDDLENRFDRKQWPTITDIVERLPGCDVRVIGDLILAEPR